ncbi:MAG: tRNA glutamyl-Q(34) synthetase GluQRS [Burkholderiaceae bacterium]
MNSHASAPRNPQRYAGRFAPSSTGPLHLGSIVAALASWLDARAHFGLWLVRIEDIDAERCRPEYAQLIERQLAAFGLFHDGEVMLQSNNHAAHTTALRALQERQQVFPCACSRASIAALHPPLGASGEPVYPGTCRTAKRIGEARSWRLRVDKARIQFEDRWLGACTQDLARECGDFVIARADGSASYHLASVVDDAALRITDVVRGADLHPLTARQIYLQQHLKLPTPRYMHVPVMVDEAGDKLSKQTLAPAADMQNPLPQLAQAWTHLGFTPFSAVNVQQFLQEAIARWAQRFALSL